MEKDSLGLIETVGYVPAIEAADAGSKAANVVFRGIGHARAGLITVMFVGDVAAVRAAVMAGATAARLVGKVVSVHVIARPDRQLHITPNGAKPARQVVTPPTAEEPPLTLEQAEEQVEALLDEVTAEATKALDEQVESIVEESECVGGNEVAMEEAEAAAVIEEEQPQPVAEAIVIEEVTAEEVAPEETPVEEEPEAVSAGRTPTPRKKEKEKVRKPKSKRKY